ncbi:alpha/beta fold hydrolase [Streptosporangium lutulentum]|uniref:Pimeloyl-ACP methyl ester carboxylesterase n=1 Tax=Streptosporangium lutulentum TaxID=1461250 RepID=A0ABT9QJ15_9ACTN|nr:alpha/beta hydrolase [Streptosporangium lutulentum]MDP9846745.1 pimeloyl-ACP methyl ester carboxylesterase [Streptosporangium lutulentum]
MSVVTRRKVGIAGAIVGVASAGVAAAAFAKRYAVGRIRLRPDLESSEPLGELRGSPVMVATSDGVELYAEVDGLQEAPLTVVFCHGYTLNLDSWHYQRRDLCDSYRLVLWDQRSHGRSPRTMDGDCTIDRLGDDLAEVIKALVPGPCVLVGHSMGGMTIMALADRHPELFRDRVKGVALISTSSGKLAEVSLGLPALLSKAVHKITPGTVSILSRGGTLVDRSRQVGNDVAFLALRHLGFGDSKNVSPTVVDFAESMIRSTPFEVIAEFYPALMSHDKLNALNVLNDVPTSIMVGDKDWLTPVEHSKAMAAALPRAQFAEIPNSSHLVQLERPTVVNDALRDLLKRVTADSADDAGDTDDASGTGGADSTDDPDGSDRRE